MLIAEADPVTGLLLQYGAVGLLALLALAAVRVLFARLTSELESHKQRGDRLELELIKINEAVRNEYLTTIAQSARATAEASQAVANALAALRRD
jgi:hypothetical protein